MGQSNDLFPPRWPARLLRGFIRKEYLEEIEGDMTEVFFDNVDAYGINKARRMYAWDVIMLARPAIIKKLYGIQPIIFTAMIRNYLTSGWRNFLKYRSYSAINVTGLCIGFAASLLLFLIVNYERSFDKFHTNYRSIYRVAEMWPGGDNVSDMIVTPQAPLMEEEYADIRHSTRFWSNEDIIQAGDSYTRSSFHVVDSGFAAMFDFKVISGNLRHAVATPDQATLTRSVAVKLFGDKNPVGQTVTLVNSERHLTVAAVVEDPPLNSTLQFEILIPWSSGPDFLAPDQAGNWYNTFMTAYVESSPAITRKEM